MTASCFTRHDRESGDEVDTDAELHTAIKSREIAFKKAECNVTEAQNEGLQQQASISPCRVARGIGSSLKEYS